MKQTTIQTDLANIHRSRLFLTIFILLLVCVVFWTITSLFNSQKETVVTPELLNSAKPMTPTIDDTVLADLELEREFTESELATFPIYRFVKLESSDEEVILPLGQDAPTFSTGSPGTSRTSPAAPARTSTPSAAISPTATPPTGGAAATTQ